MPRATPSFDLRFGLLLACFLLSGLAALIYQTAWTRQFAFVFGTSELAVATVLAAYMGGLAAGAAVAGKLSGRIRRPVRAYGLLELGIALSALAVPYAIRLAQNLHVALFATSDAPPGEGGAASALFYLASSFLILMVPTGLMGATLPLLARHAVHSDEELGRRVGILYATNTTGAVIGTVIAGFFLLPSLGLQRTVFVAVGVNGLVFVAAALLARSAAPVARVTAPVSAEAARGQSRILPIILLSGVVSFSYEVMWTRLLGQVLGGSVYAFATMLATFLVGITVGSAIAARLATNARRAAAGFAMAQIGVAVLSYVAFRLLDLMPGMVRALAGSEWRLAVDALAAGIILLPSTLCIGATFPFAVRILARGEADAGPASARVYAWNTTGSILGALGAGFLWMPALGFAGTLTAGVAVSLVLALATATLLPWRRPRFAFAAGLLLVALAFAIPEPPWQLLRTSALHLQTGRGRIVYDGVGRSATVLLRDNSGTFQLTTNGLPEAEIPPTGGFAGRFETAHWMSSLPSLARPEARSFLVVGFGGGRILEAVPASIERIDVVELEPKVIDANRAIAGERWVDPLADPRVHVIENDARNALMLTDRRYDAIASQPSHPWTAGSSHLYTQEYFELVREHLAPDGVFVQWMGLMFLDEHLLRSLVATMNGVFANVRVYQPGQFLLFIASDGELAVESTCARALAQAPEDYARVGIVAPEDLLAELALDAAATRALGAGAPVVSDDRNLLQMRSPGVVRSGSGLASTEALFAPHEPLLSLGPEWNRPYLVRRLVLQERYERALAVATAEPDPALRDACVGIVQLAAGRPDVGRQHLARALERDPDLVEARVALLRLAHATGASAKVAALANGRGDPLEALAFGWTLAAAGRWDELATLEPRFAGVPRTHPAYVEIARLRSRWRLARNDVGRAREATTLLDSVLHAGGRPEDLVLRASAAAGAGNYRAALKGIHAVLKIAKVRRSNALLDECRRLVRALPAGAISEVEERRVMRTIREMSAKDQP